MGRVLPWVTAAVVIAFDRVTKLVVMDLFEVGSRVALLPGVTLTRVHNRGIAFSLFSDGGPVARILLHLVIVSAVVVIAWMVVSHGRHSTSAGFAFGLILGGAIGNLVDRVLYGWVVDFIRLWVRLGDRSWSWPDFNVADGAITIGAAVLILTELRAPRTAANEDASDTD